MKLAVMQPYLFPYIGYFQLMKATDRFVIYDDVNHIKKGWVNRNLFLKSGEPFMFTIPIRDNSQNFLIRDLKVCVDKTWLRKTLKTIEHLYKRAPFFDVGLNIVYSVINTKSCFLIDWHIKSFEMIMGYLSIHTELKRSSEIADDKSLSGEERIISLCLFEGAKEYVNLSGGINLYNEDHFLLNYLKLWFLKPKYIEYKQFNYKPLTSLSIIDMLMFNSDKRIVAMLDLYDIYQPPKKERNGSKIVPNKNMSKIINKDY